MLIHCAQGISRSTSIAIAFLMKKENLSYSDAMRRVKQSRACAGPNFGFVVQLQLLHEEKLDAHRARKRVAKKDF